MTNVNEKFRSQMKKLGGADSVASLLEVTRAHVYFLANGKRFPSRALMIKIRNEMGIAPIEWLPGDDAA